jgi:hypothetical protein
MINTIASVHGTHILSTTFVFFDTKSLTRAVNEPCIALRLVISVPVSFIGSATSRLTNPNIVAQ